MEYVYGQQRKKTFLGCDSPHLCPRSEEVVQALPVSVCTRGLAYDHLTPNVPGLAYAMIFSSHKATAVAVSRGHSGRYYL